jgi:transcriptional regulator with XRE-family HTH domain
LHQAWGRQYYRGMSETNAPFASLGSHLRTVREQLQRSVAEVSGAVEIDQQQLEQIEAGKMRPDEDVMLLLISYFNVKDQEALHLWELARYDSELSDHIQFESADPAVAEAVPGMQIGSKPMIMLLAMDVRTMYSDGVDITVNPAGMTMQFNQAVPNQKQPAPVARIGMSHQQAEAVVKAMQQALLRARYNPGHKLLPPSTADSQ